MIFLARNHRINLLPPPPCMIISTTNERREQLKKCSKKFCFLFICVSFYLFLLFFLYFVQNNVLLEFRLSGTACSVRMGRARWIVIEATLNSYWKPKFYWKTPEKENIRSVPDWPGTSPCRVAYGKCFACKWTHTSSRACPSSPTCRPLRSKVDSQFSPCKDNNNKKSIEIASITVPSVLNRLEGQCQVFLPVLGLQLRVVERIGIEVVDEGTEGHPIGPTAAKVLHGNVLGQTIRRRWTTISNWELALKTFFYSVHYLVATCFGSTPSEKHVLDVAWIACFTEIQKRIRSNRASKGKLNLVIPECNALLAMNWKGKDWAGKWSKLQPQVSRTELTPWLWFDCATKKPEGWSLPKMMASWTVYFCIGIILIESNENINTKTISFGRLWNGCSLTCSSLPACSMIVENTEKLTVITVVVVLVITAFNRFLSLLGLLPLCSRIHGLKRTGVWMMVNRFATYPIAR